jgi:CBS domain-containing protein
MFDVRVKSVMERKKLLSTTPDTTVAKAAKLMTIKHVGAILIVEGERLLGIFTERDALFRVIARGLDPRTTRVADVMTLKPKTIGPNDSFGRALFLMHENGFRHLPVVEGNVVTGIISSRNALDPDLEEFTAEAHRREYLRAAP